ncbi:MAG: peptidoglycan DD-metalloendopeptidase family protein [Pseudomonadota bacterium]
MPSRGFAGLVGAALWVTTSSLTGLALLTVLPGSAQAQAANTGPQTAAEREAARRKLEAQRKALGDAQRRASGIQSDMAQLTAERERLNRRLLETAALIKRHEAQLDEIERRIANLDAREKVLRGNLAKRHDTIAKLLAAMQRMGRNPPPVMMTQRDDALKMVRSAMLLAATFPELRQKALVISGEIKKIIEVRRERVAERTKLRQETQALSDKRVRLTALVNEKRRKLISRQTELLALQREAEDIRRSYKSLNELITRLDQAVAARTKLGEYNRDVRRGRDKSKERDIAALNVPKPAQPAPKAPPPSTPQTAIVKPPATPQAPQPPTGPSPPDDPNITVLQPTPRANARWNPARLKPAVPFIQAKGRLPLPAQGRRVLGFGEKTQFNSRSPGIVIATRFGAQVTSPADGWVLYARQFRSYGQLLIINAGQDYHLLLAGLAQIDVQLGQFVLAGEPVGTMSPAPRQRATSGKDASPVLYIEFRKNGRPIDPDPWWARALQRAQG